MFMLTCALLSICNNFEIFSVYKFATFVKYFGHYLQPFAEKMAVMQISLNYEIRSKSKVVNLHALCLLQDMLSVLKNSTDDLPKVPPMH